MCVCVCVCVCVLSLSSLVLMCLQLCTLDLRSNDFTSASLSTLLVALKRRPLQYLDISFHRLNEAGWRAVLSLLSDQHGQMQSLVVMGMGHVDNVELTAEFAKVIAETPSLHSLDLGFTTFSPACGQVG